MKLKEKNSDHSDVLIIGGGPAGCAAGLTLLNHTSFDVCVVESTDYTNMRVGESVSPGIMPLLRYLGIENDFLSNNYLPSHGIDSSWGTSKINSRDFFFTGQGHGWNLDRRRFDKMMGDAIKKQNGTLFTTTKIIDQKRDKNKWMLTAMEKDGSTFDLTSNFVIDASGKNAFFARSNGARWNVLDYLVGVAASYDLPPSEDEQTYTLLESTQDGWWYSTRLPDDKRMVVFMTDSDIGRDLKIQKQTIWDLALKKTRHIQKTIANARLVEGPNIFPAYSQIIKKTSLSDWIPAGDAVASFDPLSSIGIGHAIVSGIESARVANNVLKSNGNLFGTYLDSIIKNFEEYVKNRRHFYGSEKRWPNKPFWKRRQR